jgi:hypothetical protein
MAQRAKDELNGRLWMGRTLRVASADDSEDMRRQPHAGSPGGRDYQPRRLDPVVERRDLTSPPLLTQWSAAAAPVPTRPRHINVIIDTDEFNDGQHHGPLDLIIGSHVKWIHRGTERTGTVLGIDDTNCLVIFIDREFHSISSQPVTIMGYSNVVLLRQ